MSHSFNGGVHPPEGKEFTEKKAVEEMPLGKEFIIPLSQHIGAPSKVLVEKEQEVKRGEVLSEAGGFVSVPVHSPVNGVVKKIDDFPNPVSGKGQAVLIERKEEDDDSWIESVQFNEKYIELSKKEMLDLIKAAGIAGMGGATFPTHVKLSPPADKKIDTLLINGAECEPYLTADHRLMLESTEEIINGVKILKKALGVNKAIIGIENNKMDAVEVMEKACKGNDGIEVMVFKVKYPQGAEKQLIKAALDRDVPAGGLPMDIGCVVSNVGTAKAVFDAVAWKKPLISRVVTVTGDGINDPKNLEIRIGTSFNEVIEHCGGLKENTKKIIMGGPMMGMAQHSLEVPVVKGTSGILTLLEKTAALPVEEPCIQCARCVEICPMGLLPTTLARLSEFDKFEDAEEKGILNCMECGSCSYICPAGRYLIQYIKFGKNKIMQAKRKA
ncbi:MAG: electron transport complex subunit RsxC [Calditrichia bacterium]|nr:electron transport complex subunit RsxC [Calditrichia bacterium]